MSTVAEPPDFDPYQQEGATWLSSRTQGLLADEMGLGKTAQAIRAFDALGAINVICLCPAVARIHWLRELSRYSARNWPSGAIQTATDVSKLPASGFVSCSYDLLLNKSVMARLQRTQWDVCLLDEAHFLRRATAARTKAALRLARQATRTWAITGTPMVRDASDLFPLLEQFGVWRGGYWNFVHQFCVVRETPFGLKILPGVKNQEQLGKMLGSVMLRRTKAELSIGLPPLMYDRVVIPSSPVERKVWECYFPGLVFNPKALQEDIAEGESTIRKLLDNTRTHAEAIKVLDALSDSAGTIKSLRQWIALQKVPGIAQLVAAELDANAYDKIVIFCVHRAMIEELRMLLAAYSPCVIYGGTPPVARMAAVDRFQTKAKYRVFIGQITAAGTAIDLTAASQVLMAESDWLPENNAQAIMRAHRRTQKRPVTVRFVEMDGSIDAHIQRICRARVRAITSVFGEAAQCATVPVDIFAE